MGRQDSHCFIQQSDSLLCLQHVSVAHTRQCDAQGTKHLVYMIAFEVRHPRCVSQITNYTADAWQSKHNYIIIITYIADDGNS